MFFYALLGVVLVLGVCQYYELFNITVYTSPLFNALYELPWIAFLTWGLLIALASSAYIYFKRHMYLDAGLAGKKIFGQDRGLCLAEPFWKFGNIFKERYKIN